MTPELMALMVHDLKNPLAALLANLGFVASTVKGDELAQEAVEDCMISTEVLNRLVENLSTLSRPETADAGTSAGSVESALKVVERRMRRHAEASSLSFSASCEPGVGFVRVSGSALELAIENLVACSLAYAPAGSSITVQARNVSAEQTTVIVMDEGPAITGEMKDLLSDLTGQLRLKGGTGARYARGLGLYVASLIATHGGGSLSAGIEEGKAALRLHLPKTE